MPLRSTMHHLRAAPRIASVLACVFLVFATLAVVARFGMTSQLQELLPKLSDPHLLSQYIERIGPWAVVGFLALAVVVSPIPSGPIAMAAGAIYGTWQGGALTAAGALIGAMGAFCLSRRFGYRPLSASRLPLANWITRTRTQRSLVSAVLVSRLIPFISFDAISYLAGLTAIRTRNFALATAIGVLPASFAFAALGAGVGGMDSALLMIVACGVTLIAPAIYLLGNRLGLRA